MKGEAERWREGKVERWTKTDGETLRETIKRQTPSLPLHLSRAGVRSERIYGESNSSGNQENVEMLAQRCMG